MNAKILVYWLGFNECSISELNGVILACISYSLIRTNLLSQNNKQLYTDEL